MQLSKKCAGMLGVEKLRVHCIALICKEEGEVVGTGKMLMGLFVWISLER